MEDGEEPIRTALREAREEIGLAEDAVVEIMGGLTPVTTGNRFMPIIPVVARIEGRQGGRHDSIPRRPPGLNAPRGH